MLVNFYFLDLFSVLHGHLFSNFPFLPNEVFHFCNLFCWAVPFSCSFSSSGGIYRFGEGCGTSCGGTLFAHLTLSWISWSSVGVSFCSLSIYRDWLAKFLASISGLESWFLLHQSLGSVVFPGNSFVV